MNPNNLKADSKLLSQTWGVDKINFGYKMQGRVSRNQVAIEKLLSSY